MDRYHIALFIHLMTLMVAAGATAVTKLAAGRRARARTVGEVLEWHNVLESAAKVFPICLVVFVVTGAYMLSIAHVAVWSSGFVVAGLVGSALLFASGGYLGAKGAALRKILEQVASKGADQPAPKLVPPALVAALPLVNTGIAVSVAFDMVTKPASIPVALGVIAIGIVLGAAKGLQRPAVSVQPSPAAQA
ncbi:MAG TPA: hypothetical protein VIP11_16610 [Gemmatimonadaceae bacterium]